MTVYLRIRKRVIRLAALITFSSPTRAVKALISVNKISIFGNTPVIRPTRFSAPALTMPVSPFARFTRNSIQVSSF